MKKNRVKKDKMGKRKKEKSLITKKWIENRKEGERQRSGKKGKRKNNKYQT